ncbi:MAG: NAD+ synthase [bacterium]
MKIGCLQLNAAIGAFDANIKKTFDAYQRAVRMGADIVAAPELFISGYPPRDLLHRRDFIQANMRALDKLAQHIGEIPLIIGTLAPSEKRPGKPLFNSAAILLNGGIHRLINKSLLPFYDVFDETRYFEPAEDEPFIFAHRGARIGVTICEDIWNDEDFWPERLYRRDPVKNLVAQGVNVLINIAASPWHLGKERLRQQMLSRIARDEKISVIQINTVGGNDELLFDGQSMAFNTRGELIFLGNAFGEDVAVIDLQSAPIIPQPTEEPAQLFYALAMGVRDYVHKCGFSKVALGLSGGIDSSLVAAIAVEALGPDNVLGVAMPSDYSSPASLTDAESLARVLEIEFQIVPIQENFEHILRTLLPTFGKAAWDTTEENIQSRLRGLLLMAISNKTERLVLTTGNKSELAVGYCTLYGDMCGSLAVIGDVLKTQIYRIAEWLNKKTTIIPPNAIARPPSAELRPNQTDQDTLPPYAALDDIIRAYVVEEKTLEEILALGHDEKTVRDILRKITSSEFKRRQAPPTLKITPKAFGTGRRQPIAQRFES